MANQLIYLGSGHHKRFPGDYKFQPPVNPRPWKSLCDGKRCILRSEAESLLKAGVAAGLFSDFPQDGFPKYVWCVEGSDVYEAKTDKNAYHGYLLEEDDEFRAVVMKEWEKRCTRG